MDDQLTVLVESVRQLGQELAETATNEAALRSASERIDDVMADVWVYLDEIAVKIIMEEMWAEAGMQSEEDAEYG